MSDVRNLHDEAMKLAHLALVARSNQDWAGAENLSRQALEYEAKAADLIKPEQASEPTRSILYRSAASLAYQCKEFAVAQRLIAKGLSGYPPPQIEQELKDLYEQVNFEYHLKVRDISLENEDLQLSLTGESVGFGTIIYDEFLNRIKILRNLIDRTVQRIMGATYQSSGRVAQIYRPFIPALSVARSGSYVITIKLAVAKGGQMPLLINAAQVIDEIVSGVELINCADEKSLRDKIPQENYYRNFVALTRDMAPDGEKIKFVGFTSLRKEASLTRNRNEIEILSEPKKDDTTRTPITIKGILDYATARKQKEAFGITTEDGKEYNVMVQEGLDDLVRTYFKQAVEIKGYLEKKKTIYLTDVRAID